MAVRGQCWNEDKSTLLQLVIPRLLPPLDCEQLGGRGHVLSLLRASEPEPHTGPGTQQAHLMLVQINGRMVDTSWFGQESPQISENIPKEPDTATVPLAEQQDLSSAY